MLITFKRKSWPDLPEVSLTFLCTGMYIISTLVRSILIRVSMLFTLYVTEKNINPCSMHIWSVKKHVPYTYLFLDDLFVVTIISGYVMSILIPGTEFNQLFFRERKVAFLWFFVILVFLLSFSLFLPSLSVWLASLALFAHQPGDTSLFLPREDNMRLTMANTSFRVRACPTRAVQQRKFTSSSSFSKLR